VAQHGNLDAIAPLKSDLLAPVMIEQVITVEADELRYQLAEGCS
jgi:hypothetical protein